MSGADIGFRLQLSEEAGETLKESLRIVILKCPYANWKNENTQQIFVKTVDLKLSGYLSRHAFGAMPIDGTDFVCDHLLICKRQKKAKINPVDGINREGEEELLPILGVKTLPYDYCGPFPIEFTIEAFLKRTKCEQHLNALYDILQKTRENCGRINYYSSWTIHPEILPNRPLVALLKDIFACMTVLYHQEEGVGELLGLGVPKYRTEKFFYTWGFERVSQGGQELPCIPFSILHKIDGVFMHLKNYSKLALDMAEAYRYLWDDKLVIGRPPVFQDDVKGGEAA